MMDRWKAGVGSQESGVSKRKAENRKQTAEVGNLKFEIREQNQKSEI